MFSSRKSDWETPWPLFRDVDREFHFTLDVCATKGNTKVPGNYFTPGMNGLRKDWRGVCWMNPPYGHEIRDWVRKAYVESETRGATVVCLLPARTDTRWFHHFCWNADAILFFKGRIRFVGCDSAAPYPSCLVVFGGGFPEDTKLGKYGKIIDLRGVRL